MFLSAMSIHLLNTCRDGHSTTSPSSLFQCLTTFSVKKFFIMSNLNLPLWTCHSYCGAITHQVQSKLLSLSWEIRFWVSVLLFGPDFNFGKFSSSFWELRFECRAVALLLVSDSNLLPGLSLLPFSFSLVPSASSHLQNLTLCFILRPQL